MNLSRLLAWASKRYHWTQFGLNIQMRREMDDRNTDVDPREGNVREHVPLTPKGRG